MGLSAGTAYIDAQPRVGAGFQGAIASKLGPIGLGAGAVLGAGIAAGIGGAVALGKIGETFDSAFDTIRTGTGAVGEDLEALQGDFKAVFQDVPADAETVAAALADINTRTGATGETLQGLTAQIVELGRITGEDTSKLVETSTRVFGDWGVSIEDGEAAMDALFRASQATGPPVSRLQELLVKYGAPLRQFGFGMEESAALLGKFEKEGVNTELVMGSMRVALGKIAREGGDPATALQETVDAIANAGSAGEANALALELFGARAGPDMAAAIREGRFELGDLFAQVSDGSDTIRGVATETSDWRESWELLKNRVFVALEPLATKLFTALGEGLGWLAEQVGPFMEILGNAFGFIRDLFAGIGSGASGAQTAVGGAVEGIGGLWAKLGDIFSAVGEVVRGIFDGLRAFWEDWGGTITSLFRNAFDTVVNVLSAVFDVIKGIFDTVLGVLTGDWERAWEGLKGIVGGILDAIKGVIEGALKNVVTVAKGIMTNFGDAIGRGVDNVVDFFKKLPGRIFEFLVNLPRRMADLARDLVEGLLNGLGNIAKKLGDKLKAGIGKAVDAVKGFFGIGSPSKVMAEVLGLPLAEGVALGAEATGRLTGAALAAGITEGMGTATRALAAVSGRNLVTVGVAAAGPDDDEPRGPGRGGPRGPDLPPIYADIYIDGIGKIAEGVRIHERTWKP